ncbi:MAG: hypothetical protein ACD_87C00193G0004 [uncultured bacterium]|nr:MAG: hypothetical protein ACD_87C00193G0004 [uncultured bacterium]
MPVFLVCIGVNLLFGLLGEVDLQHTRDKCLPAGSDDADGELSPGEESFDQDGLSKCFKKQEADAFKRRPVGDLRSSRHAFSRPFGDRLGKKRKRQSHPLDLLRRFDDSKIRGRDPEVPDHPFCHPLVEGERQNEWIGKYVRNIVCFK